MFTPVLIRMLPTTFYAGILASFLAFQICVASATADSSDAIPADSPAEASILNKSSSKAKEWYHVALSSLNKSGHKLSSYADKTYGSLDVIAEGLDKLSIQEFQALIPSGKSYYWWWSNQNSIVASLKQHPLVEQAQIESCPEGRAMRCFLVKIKERTPNLWVKSEWDKGKETRFLIADDGAVLSVLSTDQQMQAVSRFDRKLLARYSSEALTGLPVLDARNLANISDASQQLFSRAVQLVSVIEKESGAEVYELQFLGDHEVEVEFESQPFKVVFNIESNNSLSALIAAQMLRLEKILLATPQVSSRAVSINLGLEREAFAVLAKGDMGHTAKRS